ncbi:MAG TPA: energy transducer TonB [Edaphobacter sp.]|uniref:energy transducer TonB n=1 Tax=Edaphobacter sp. TaxID=1934404 RepID=UPI002BE32FCD|nr:energy transducer TonB [Edaphobacter sp.]HUZ96223.1 energy transducer TonB [Edaphobacter sp.]
MLRLDDEALRRTFMVKPLRSDNPAPQNIQFKHFGILNDGSQSKSSLYSSIVINVLIAVVIIIIGAAVRNTIVPPEKKLVTLIEPLPLKPPPPPPVIHTPPMPKPPVVQPQPPKIKVPEVKEPEPKVPVVHMTRPVPVVVPAPPKRIEPPPAPKVVHLGRAQAAAVVNNSPHPSPVALGRPDNPIAPSNRPAVSSINLGQRGMAGMPASNSGAGPAAKAVTLGSGSSGSQNMNGRDNASGAVRGVRLGVAGSNGPMNSHSREAASPVNLGRVAPPPAGPSSAPTYARSGSAPKVLYKPRPQYTAEAIKEHIEGTVSVRLRVSASGTVQVLGVTRDLGHGLGESAIRAVEGTRFSPATDASGRPVDWEGVVNVAFQLAG